MKKEEFLTELRNNLQGLPKEDVESRVSFYSEMIDDRIDEGKTEEEVIAELGGIDKVVNDIADDTSLVKLVKDSAKPKKKLSAWVIVLIILGSPLWIPLLLVFIVLCLVGYLLVWTGVLVCYALEIGFACGTVYGLVGFIYLMSVGMFSMSHLGTFLLCLGLVMLFVFACVGITKATFKLSKTTMRNIKSWFIRRKA